MPLPNLKKKISAFLIGEDGKISKENLIKTGIIIAGTAVFSLPKSVNADYIHSNNLNLTYTNNLATGTHTHHSSHSSHGSHSSHSAHGSCGGGCWGPKSGS